MKTGNNNILSKEQVSNLKEKYEYIVENQGINKQNKALMTLVSKCLRAKEKIPYSEYISFNRLYAEISQKSFDKDINNKAKNTIPTVSAFATDTIFDTIRALKGNQTLLRQLA